MTRAQLGFYLASLVAWAVMCAQAVSGRSWLTAAIDAAVFGFGLWALLT